MWLGTLPSLPPVAVASCKAYFKVFFIILLLTREVDSSMYNSGTSLTTVDTLRTAENVLISEVSSFQG